MVVSSQFHVLTALPLGPGQEHPVHIDWRAGWVPQPIQAFCWREKSLAPARNQPCSLQPSRCTNWAVCNSTLHSCNSRCVWPGWPSSSFLTYSCQSHEALNYCLLGDKGWPSSEFLLHCYLCILHIGFGGQLGISLCCRCYITTLLFLILYILCAVGNVQMGFFPTYCTGCIII